MTRITNSLLVVAAGGLLFAGLAAAQNSTTATTTQQTTTTAPTANDQNVGPGERQKGHSWENHVNKREGHQQNRIANGVKDGQLSASQAAQLEKSQAKIQGQEARAEAAHNGHLTANEKRNFQREQNQQNRKIRDDRHPNLKK